jgi:putative colanic acid biosynthesis glycosyltransferase
MKQILQICVEGNRGSVGRMAENLGSFAMSLGWSSYIAFGRYPRRSESHLYRIGSDFETLLHVIESRIFGKTGSGSRFATWRLIRYIKRLNPDLIHLHHIHGYYLNYEILFAYLKASNKPIVWTFHDCWSFTGQCPYFEIVSCEKWKSQCYSCPQTHKYPKSWFIDSSRHNFLKKRRIFNSVDNMVIVSVSNWLDFLVGKSFLQNHDRRVIYNGVDQNVFNGKKRDFDGFLGNSSISGKFVILGVANVWEERKGLSDFVEFSNLLFEDEIILLVGVEKKIASKLPKNIIAIERTENVTALAAIYQKADVYCNLSREETFGLTTAEALSCGTPVIVYNCSANPELVDESVGYVVQKGDFSGLRSAIDSIKCNTKNYYTSSCVERAVLNFGDQGCFRSYLKLYEDLINHTRVI